jgi:hypothetical protein
VRTQLLNVRKKIPTHRIRTGQIADQSEECKLIATDGFGEETGDEGLKFVSLSRPDLLKRIRSIDPGSKVIMVTGNADPLLAREALELGAVAYVGRLRILARQVFIYPHHRDDDEPPGPRSAP